MSEQQNVDLFVFNPSTLECGNMEMSTDIPNLSPTDLRATYAFALFGVRLCNEEAGEKANDLLTKALDEMNKTVKEYEKLCMEFVDEIGVLISSEVVEAIDAVDKLVSVFQEYAELEDNWSDQYMANAVYGISMSGCVVDAIGLAYDPNTHRWGLVTKETFITPKDAYKNMNVFELGLLAGQTCFAETLLAEAEKGHELSEILSVDILDAGLPAETMRNIVSRTSDALLDFVSNHDMVELVVAVLEEQFGETVTSFERNVKMVQMTPQDMSELLNRFGGTS